MTRRFTAVAALLLVALSGCGSAAAERAVARPGTPADGARQMEAIRGDCMREKGFRYVPYVPPPRRKTAAEVEEEAGDYQAMKRFRQKNGYGVFAFYVYPQEYGNPMVPPDRPLPPDPDPNHKLIASLSKTQFRAYQEADQECLVRAVKTVVGKDVKSIGDQVDQANTRAAQLKSHALDGDPLLAGRAAAMATCLEDRGYRIGSTRPTAMADRGRAVLEAIKKPMGTRIPEDVRMEMDQPEGALFEPDLSVGQARPYLAEEITDALDDLECGRDFYTVYEPRRTAIEARAYTEFGLYGLL
ncbi:hypothetical protein Psi02_40790 [Planotetraspora silvatica]|uniref:Lipoprotein n=1 Tax=Planotetraspora silvatica TaxID=234614 RepID=A0A8J3V0B0_9ACTN|nr:hypothetical protein [Planotetraspora silvatica]GII47655.1 hypothetical protein Psi02_40790 [Planotetraspora silvatica]